MLISCQYFFYVNLYINIYKIYCINISFINYFNIAILGSLLLIWLLARWKILHAGNMQDLL